MSGKGERFEEGMEEFNEWNKSNQISLQVEMHTLGYSRPTSHPVS